jgi:hypothetical protein
MKTKIHTLVPLALVTSLLLACAALVSGCASGPEKRISQDQQLFDSLPPETQASIRAGKVELGFTPAMVVMTLGKPSRQFTRTTEKGTSEVWSYTKRKSSMGLSFGIGGGTGRGIGTGLGIGVGGGRTEEIMRIIFDAGKVTAIEGTATK